MSLKFICESRQVSEYFWQYSVSKINRHNIDFKCIQKSGLGVHCYGNATDVMYCSIQSLLLPKIDGKKRLLCFSVEEYLNIFEERKPLMWNLHWRKKILLDAWSSQWILYLGRKSVSCLGSPVGMLKLSIQHLGTTFRYCLLLGSVIWQSEGWVVMLLCRKSEFVSKNLHHIDLCLWKPI